MRARLKPIREQTIVITGASSGNGLATAHAAVERGAAVVLAARNGEALASIRDELRAKQGRAEICIADVSREDDVERIGATAMAAFGGFDSWVNNAATATFGTIEQVSTADHRRVFDVNYFGYLYGCRMAARQLRARGGGAIVNVGSILGDRAIIDQGPYCATKHAIQALTDVLRMELERDRAGISVTLIKPGAIDTPYPEHARNLMDEPPRLPPPLYDPSLVADAVLFACETPRRVLYVGGAGLLSSMIGRAAPRLTDLVMEVIGRMIQEKPSDPGDPAARDNLYQARKDGAVHGSQHVAVRRTSLTLALQKLPRAVPLAAAGVIGALGARKALSALARRR
ncbi:MAG: SDR family oxidoreductase [Sphingomicrobium sp.]|nr:SDR family NAD(P)-dependent oxidoreductase [Sphingomonadales bacterium]